MESHTLQYISVFLVVAHCVFLDDSLISLESTLQLSFQPSITASQTESAQPSCESKLFWKHARVVALALLQRAGIQ